MLRLRYGTYYLAGNPQRGPFPGGMAQQDQPTAQSTWRLRSLGRMIASFHLAAYMSVGVWTANQVQATDISAELVAVLCRSEA